MPDRLRRKPHAAQPFGFTLRVVLAGNFASLAAEREGRSTSWPPQLGQTPLRTLSVQAAQKVHSNEQTRAS